MSDQPLLTLESSAQPDFTTKAWRQAPERVKPRQQHVRAPFGDVWFAVGDGRPEPEVVSIEVVVRGADIAAAQAQRDTLIAVLQTLTRVRTPTRYRNTHGVARWIVLPSRLGYAVRFDAQPTGADWVAT